MTGAELVAAYLAHQERRGRPPGSLRTAAYRLQPLLALSAPLSEWREEHLIGLRRQLLAQGRSESFIFDHLVAARTILRWAHRSGFLLVDWTRGLELPRPPRAPARVPTPEQMAACLAVPDPTRRLGLRDLAVLETLYGTGIRRSELVALDVSDLDLVDRSLRVQRAKRGGEQRHPIGEHLAAVLERWLLEGRPTFRLKLGHQALFVSRRGRRLEPSCLLYLLRQIGLAAGLSFHLAPHRIRHAYATHLLLGGAPCWAVQALLGHRRPDSLQVYTHLTLEDLRRELARTHPRWGWRRRRS